MSDLNYQEAVVASKMKESMQQVPQQFSPDAYLYWFKSFDEYVRNFVEEDKKLKGLLPLVNILDSTTNVTTEEMAERRLRLERTFLKVLAFIDPHDGETQLKVSALQDFLINRGYDARGGYRGNRVLEHRSRITVDTAAPKRKKFLGVF